MARSFTPAADSTRRPSYFCFAHHPAQLTIFVSPLATGQGRGGAARRRTVLVQCRQAGQPGYLLVPEGRLHHIGTACGRRGPPRRYIVRPTSRLFLQKLGRHDRITPIFTVGRARA